MTSYQTSLRRTIVVLLWSASTCVATQSTAAPASRPTTQASTPAPTSQGAQKAPKKVPKKPLGAKKRRPPSLTYLSAGGGITVRFKKGASAQLLGAPDTLSRLELLKTPRQIRVITTHGGLFYDDLTIVVPPGTSLRLKSISGSIKIGAGAHHVEASTLSGSLSVQAVSGSARLRTVSGSITLQHAKEAYVSTVSGDMTLHKISGPVRAKSVSGSIRVSQCRALTMSAQTMSGSIRVQKSITQQSLLKTFSGDITLYGPIGATASLFANTFSGDIRIHWPRTGKVSVQATSSSGDTQIPPALLQTKSKVQLKLQTSSGDIKWRWLP